MQSRLRNSFQKVNDLHVASSNMFKKQLVLRAVDHACRKIMKRGQQCTLRLMRKCAGSAAISIVEKHLVRRSERPRISSYHEP